MLGGRTPGSVPCGSARTYLELYGGPGGSPGDCGFSERGPGVDLEGPGLYAKGPGSRGLDLGGRGRSGEGRGRLGGLWLLRGLALRLWSRRGLVLLALLWFGSWLVLNGVVLVRKGLLTDFCTDSHSQEILRTLCLDFSSGLVSGDMCVDLCVLRQLRYRRCLYFENGKKVMEAEWRGRAVILKSRHENFSSYEPLSALQDQNAAEDLSPLDVVYYATLEVRNSLGLTEDEDAVPSSLAENTSEESEGSKHLGRSYSRADLASLWALLQQEEYTFLRVLQDLSPHVARVLGSCGHFYAVEFLSAGRAWDQNLFSLADPPQAPPPAAASTTHSSRDHRIALSFLDLVWHFEHDFTHSLHLCDIKPENFGIRTDLTVVAIDVDMAFFEPKMREILEQNCSSDDDCSFFDCASSCEAQRCSPHRSNSNLQVICEKIFRPWFSPSLLGAKAGLPLQVELQRAVQQCSETDLDLGRAKHPGGREDVHRRLVNVLTRLVEEGGASAERVGGALEESHAHTALNF